MAARLRLVRVRAVLGRGTLTETLVAELAAAGRPPFVAVVKRLHPNLVDDRGAIARVADEARALGRLVHPRIPALLGVGEDDGLPFFAQALVDGRPVPGGATLSWQELAVVLVDVAGALAAAHAAGIVHRDVSRHNVLVDIDGRGWLVDFGVSRAEDRPRRTRSGAVVGTPAAMPPEQARGEAVAAAADVWAVGVLAMTFLGAGHPLGLLDDDPAATRLAKVRGGRLDDDALGRLDALAPPTLAAIVRRCLAPAVGDRLADGAAVAAAIDVVAAMVEPGAIRSALGQRLATATPTAGAGETLDDGHDVTAPRAPRRQGAGRRGGHRG